ncbi:MAG TPA: hypothetical protein VFS30_12305 [Dehalococcoidia bacterium]|nr:hypothetical protein [Dehalococcoidia bacterium]
MKPPLLNFVLGLLGAFVLFVGIAVHPNVLISATGLLLSLIAILFRFERRESSRRRQP